MESKIILTVLVFALALVCWWLLPAVAAVHLAIVVAAAALELSVIMCE